MLWWWVLGVAGWLTILTAVWALLTTAKRADAALDAREAESSVEIAAAAVPHVGHLLGDGAEAVVIAAHEPGPVGRVVVVAVGGAAAGLIGRELRFDDSVVAKAALSGEMEITPGMAAAPLRRRGRTVGAIGVSGAPDSPPSPRQLTRLRQIAEDIDRQLDPISEAELGVGDSP